MLTASAGTGACPSPAIARAREFLVISDQYCNESVLSRVGKLCAAAPGVDLDFKKM